MILSSYMKFSDDHTATQTTKANKILGIIRKSIVDLNPKNFNSSNNYSSLWSSIILNMLPLLGTSSCQKTSTPWREYSAQLPSLSLTLIWSILNVSERSTHHHSDSGGWGGDMIEMYNLLNHYNLDYSSLLHLSHT